MSTPSDPKDPWAYDPAATQAVPTPPPTAPAPTSSPYPTYPNPWDQYPQYQQQPPQYGQYSSYAGQYGPAYNPYPVGGPYQPGYAAATNGKATASLICAIASIFCFGPFLAIPAIILGFVARSEIKRTGGQQPGSGLALAGIIIGVIVTVLYITFFTFAFTYHGGGGGVYDDSGTF